MLTDGLYNKVASGPFCSIPAIAKIEMPVESEIIIQPSFLWIEQKYTDKKNATANANDTKPCRESDATIAVTDSMILRTAKTLNVDEKFLTNKIVKARTEKIAMRADAKFGFPTVAITAL